MSEKTEHAKGQMVISGTRSLVLKRATLVSRGLELITELDNRQVEISDKRKMKILVVDDEKSLVENISETLIHFFEHDAHGIWFGFDSEREVMEQIYSENYDILILGIIMPGITGLELTRKIRSQGFDIPIILMTGYSIPIRAIESMRSGADDLLIKPFSGKELSSSIEAVLKQRSINIKYQSRDLESYTETQLEDPAHRQSPNLHGVVREYYETGELMAVLMYREGKLNGVSKIYRKWGVLLAEASFKNGLAHGRTKWFKNDGRPREVATYENGHRKGSLENIRT